MREKGNNLKIYIKKIQITFNKYNNKYNNQEIKIRKIDNNQNHKNVFKISKISQFPQTILIFQTL